MTQVKIGLETHVQLDTETKLFCGCPNEDAEEPNSNVCETCLGHPGSRPRLNEKALEHGVKTAKALNCNINRDIFFSRKTYFYPDMSKNFQITQYEVPVGQNGNVEIEKGDGMKEVGIQRLHIEEDPAKLEHQGGSISNARYTLVDYNRAGTPLLEIVTKPDLRSPEEAREYIQQLARILEYLGLYRPESNFAIKSDANISINGGERVEVKNITGTADIEKALDHEIKRQEKLEERGESVTQQTRSFNQDRGVTEKLREKEAEEDYGYIFDPDLTRQELDQDYLEKIEHKIPELPNEKKNRFREEFSISEEMVDSIVTEPELANDFEALAEKFEAELAASWMTGELKKTLNYNELSYHESGVGREELEYILELLESDEISDRNAEKLIQELVENPRDPEEIVEEQDLLKAGDDKVNSIVREVIEENQDAVDDFNSGDEGAINFLVGQVMQNSGGKADPKEAREKLLEELED